MALDRTTFDAANTGGGKARIRGMRVTVSVVRKHLAGGMTPEQILADYPYLERKDIDQCVEYAAMLADERVLPAVR